MMVLHMSVLQVWYYGVIYVGSPPYAVNAVFDTSSSDLFVPDRNCSTTKAKGKEELAQQLMVQRS